MTPPDDLNRQIADLEAALAQVLPDAARAALEKELAALRQQQVQGQVGVSDHARVDGPAVGVNMGTVQATYHQHDAPPDPALDRQHRALRTFLESSTSACNALPLGAIDSTDAAHQRPLELAQVYISLHTTTQVGAGDEEQQTRPLPALEALPHTPQRRLMLLGAPGSGKSTFVSHLASCLGRATLDGLRDDAPAADSPWMTHLPIWSLGPLLPIRVVLRDYAAFASSAPADQRGVALLHAFLDTMLAEVGASDAREPLTQRLSDGTALLLLDGLDEVVGGVLPRVAESITATARAYPDSPVLVTCRVLDYQAEPQRQVAGFATHTLADFTDEQVSQFVVQWYAELAASGRRTPRQAREDAARLKQAIQAREELQALAGLPLLLTVMALVHTNRGTLPDARALLYEECIDILLLRWRQQQGEDLLTRLELPQFRTSDLLALMARLGFAAHEQAARTEQTESRPADLEERDIMALLAQEFAQYDEPRRYALAQTVVDALTRGNGVLLKRGPGVYAFPHRTFQEFLAGYHLMGQPNTVRECLTRSTYPHWYEPLLLMVGYQVLTNREFDKPLQLAESLLQRSAAEQVLAGEVLLTIGRERLANYDAAQMGKDGLWRRVHRALLKLATQGQAPDGPVVLRDRAGLVMGRLCTYAAPKAAAPVYDPRLPLAVVGLPAQRSAAWQQSLQHYWCPIEAGRFWFGAVTYDYGDSPPDVELRQVELPYPFKIARYPVTNADYARFIADGGYERQEWWTERGWDWLKDRGITEPGLWYDPRWNNAAQPVVAVTWYEAVAYCAWLTAQGHTAGWLPEGECIRLPTSLEWERAARGTDQRPYPWGDAEPTPEHANYGHNIGRTTPVGAYPLGRAACGALDMAGQVMEWLATPYNSPEQVEPQGDFEPYDGVLRTYDDWSEGSEHLCCGSRNAYFADIGDFDLGFRLSWSLVFDIMSTRNPLVTSES